MCDFKVGDQVVCVDASASYYHGFNSLLLGAVYRVAAIDGLPPEADGTIGLHLSEIPTPAPSHIGWASRRFKKVQRRDLSAWLGTAATDTDHLDKPIKMPARPKVDALLKRVQSGEFG